MSLRYEQYRALRSSRDFLTSLLHSSTRPRTAKELKARAYACLRHYPMLTEAGQPLFSQDSFREVITMKKKAKKKMKSSKKKC